MNDTTTSTATPPAAQSRAASPARAQRQSILVRDLTLAARIGVSDAEQERAQRLRINLEIAVAVERPLDDDLERVVDYTDLVPAVRRLCRRSRPRLLETLADEIAAICLTDPRAASAKVRIEKLDLHPDTAGVGIEVAYERTSNAIG